MGQSDKQLHVHVTQSGRPVGRFPVFIWRKETSFLLVLYGIDISDNGNFSAEPIYKALMEFIPGNVSILRIANLAILLSWRRIHMEIINEKSKE